LLTEWSTAALPKSRRFERWQEIISEAYAPLTPYRETSAAFHGSIRARKVGRCSIVQLTADPHGVTRGQSEIKRSDGNYYSIGLIESGTGVMVHKGKTVQLHAGDVRLTDYDYPLDLIFRDRFSMTSFMIPRGMLYPRLVDAGEAPATLISANSGLGRLVRSYLKELSALPDPDLDKHAIVLVDALCDVLSVAIDSASPESADGVRTVKRVRISAIKDYIRQNLSDPNLSPSMVSQACGISVRYVHKLFELEGESFGRWVLRQRLERCRKQISDPRFSEKSLSVISYNWGFNNLSHFDRAFRAAYGACPREYRKQAFDAVKPQ